MTRRLVAPRRRMRRAARMARSMGEPRFDLAAVAARSAGEPGMPPPPWPSGDIAFLAAVLDAHHVPRPVIDRLAETAATLPITALLFDRLNAALGEHIRFSSLAEFLRAPVILLLGPPGAGKTTLAAKLAARLGERRALLVSTDTSRAGSIAQLEEYGAVLGLKVAPASDADQLRHLMARAHGRSLVIDTAGIAPGDGEDDEKLAALIEASGAEPLLALPADSAAAEAAAMVRLFAPLGTRTLIPTRLDLIQRWGGVLAAAAASAFSLPAAGITPHFAYGLRPLTPAMMARRLLAHALTGMRAQVSAA